MNELIQLALSTKAALRVLETELEKVCKDKQLPLKERLEALQTLGKIGGGHSDWLYSGWDKLDDGLVRDMWSERKQEHNLLELLENHIQEARPDLEEKIDAYYESIPKGQYGDMLDFLLFTECDLQTIEFVECLCDDATLTFNYDW